MTHCVLLLEKSETLNSPRRIVRVVAPSVELISKGLTNEIGRPLQVNDGARKLNIAAFKSEVKRRREKRLSSLNYFVVMIDFD